MRKYLVVLALAVTALMTSVRPASASMIGISVAGTLRFNGGGPNFFDPANGFVPAVGFLNSAGATVTVADPATEFGFADSINTDSANFTGTQLIVGDVSGSGTAPWVMTFTSAGFAGLTLAEVSDSFPTAGGVTASLVGNVLTLSFAGVNSGFTGSAIYNLLPTAAVPEPGTILLLGSGLVGAVRARRRARR